MINMNDDIIHRDIFDPTLNERIKEVEKLLASGYSSGRKLLSKRVSLDASEKRLQRFLKSLWIWMRNL